MAGGACHSSRQRLREDEERPAGKWPAGGGAWHKRREMLQFAMFNLIKWPAFGENGCFRIAVSRVHSSGEAFMLQA